MTSEIQTVICDVKEHQHLKGHICTNCRLDEHKLSDEEKNISENIGLVFAIFAIIWTFIVAINRFYNSAAWPILLIPYAAMGIGYLNKERIVDDMVEQGVFSATFITMGLIISMPLLGYMNNKILGNVDKDDNKQVDEKKKALNTQINHIILLAIIITLLSYIHIWVDQSLIHVCKVIRSCFEMMAVTLYIFALTIFFVMV